MTIITIEQQIQCVERELAYRKRVYDRQVKEGKMTRKLAEYQTDCMQAVLETLQAHHVKSGPTQPSVFDVLQQPQEKV